MDDQVAETVVADSPEPAEGQTEELQETSQESLIEASDDVEGDDESEAESFEEIDFDGKKYAVPAELKEAFLRQADYTRKTQEVATTRQALEQQQQQFEHSKQAQQQNLQAYANLAALDGQLTQYQNVDWQQYSQDDPVKAQQSYFQYQTLKDQRQQIAGALSQQEQTALQQRQQNAVSQVEHGRASLAKEIPNWSADLAKDLNKAGQEHYGFKPNELENVVDPRMVRVLHDAYQFRKMMTKAKAKPPGPDVQPVRSVKGKAPARKDPNKMGMDDWMAWRNKQVG